MRRVTVLRLLAALLAIYCLSSVHIAFAATVHLGVAVDGLSGEWAIDTEDACSLIHNIEICQFDFVLGCNSFTVVWRDEQSWLFRTTQNKSCPRPKAPVIFEVR